MGYHTSCHVVLNAFNMTTNNSAIAIDMTPDTDIIRFALHQPTTFYENDSFILDRNCETRTLKETFKREDKSKICVFDNSKSD